MSTPPSLLDRIHQNAQRDSIDLSTLPFLPSALTSISCIRTSAHTTPTYNFSSATRIDTHTHPIPPWFRALEPNAAGRTTPEWNVSSHLEFMSTRGIKRSVLCISTPQANAFQFELDPDLRKAKTVALARLLNEYVAELCRVYPDRFSWMAVVPLPYVDEAIAEAKYALEELGAVGVGVLTNHEGVYVGEGEFGELWAWLEGRAKESGKDGGEGREVVFMHPTEPVIRLEDGRLVNSRPSPLRSGLGEFYFETARAISSLSASFSSQSSNPSNATSASSNSSTLTSYPSIHFRISHGAGAFPDISERFLLGFPSLSDAARLAYKTRFWYDSAGPVFPRQIKGLLEGMGVGVERMVFGTDYPYGIGFWDVDANIAGLADADFLSDEEKEGVFWRNAEELWRGKIPES